MIQEWQWMALALIAVTFAGSMRSLNWLWASLASTAVGTLVWADKAFPVMYQLLVFGAIMLAGVAISQFLIKPRLKSDEDENEQEPVIRAGNPARVVNRTYTLSEPIVDGFGEIEIEGVTWRVRGEDAAAGEHILVLGVDGLERDLLIVTKAE